ncbi:MAG TPA: ArgR family transcriptional regulator [Rectinemataceae bacterium]|nr:ArgR family transcriptional regulator [Rectinemataceae bacterium]
MYDRYDRLRAIKDILRAKRVDSQDLLLRYLEDEGHAVTQATLSRDLKYLKVAKIPDGKAGYYYGLPSEEEREATERQYVQDFLRGYVSVDWNQTTVVIRTFSGHSDSVSLALDNMGLEEVLGTIAGRDNVVFVALREGVTGGAFVSALRKRIPEFETE